MGARALAAAALAVLVIVVVAVSALQGRRKKAGLYVKLGRLYEKRADRLGAAAAQALRCAADRAAPTAADHYRAATIIHRNVLTQEHRPRGAPTADDLELSRLRRLMFGRARAQYAAALAGLTDAAVARDEAGRAVRRARGDRGEPAGQPGAETIIGAALEFAYEGLATFLANDPLQAAAPAPDGALAALAADRRRATVESRLAAAGELAAAQGGAPGVRAQAFLDLSQRNTSDAQNSHDPSVNAAKRAAVKRLRADQGAQERLPTLDQIAEEIRRGSAAFTRDPRTSLGRPALAQKALAVVRRARRGERSSSAQATDQEVLRRVWARADDPRNAARRGPMRQAAFDALVDSWERGLGGEQIQCVDGRISRMVGSLTLLDCDEQNWEMRRLEQHKNEIFAKAAGVIRAAAADAAGDAADPALQKVGRAYLATSAAELRQIGPLDGAKEAEWAASTRERISRMVDAHLAELDQQAPGAVPGHAVSGVKAEALAALAG